MKASFLFALMLMSSFFGHASGATSQASLETDEAKFIRLTQLLEIDPLGDKDKGMRTWLIGWAAESPDVSVAVCDTLGLISEQDVPYGPELLTQSIFGNAAFQIAHPKDKDNFLLTQLAGVASSLKAYASIIVQHPQARIPHLDDLLQKQQMGSLEHHMALVIEKKCNEQTGT